MNTTKVLVKTGIRAAMIGPGLVAAGMRDGKSIVWYSIIGSAAVTLFQVAIQALMKDGGRLLTDDSEDED